VGSSISDIIGRMPFPSMLKRRTLGMVALAAWIMPSFSPKASGF
jgi:hypothetical protein